MKRADRATWVARVDELGRSGLTVKAYADRIGVNSQTLANWRWRLGCERRAAAEATATHSSPPTPVDEATASPVKFVEVIGAAMADERLEVVLPRGATVRVPNGFDSDALRRLVAVLEGR
jgi:transposase-like protein